MPKSRSIDIKQRLRTLDNKPDRYRIKSKLRSKTIVGDNNFEKYVKVFSYYLHLEIAL